MRTFIIVSHTVPVSTPWKLDDLAGAAGRVDVLCRAVTAALCTSHGLRRDTNVVLVLAAEPDSHTAIRFEGGAISHLNPDERSTAARIRQAIDARHDDPWWNTVQPGLTVAPFTLAEVLADDADSGPVVLLDAEGSGPSKVLPGVASGGRFLLSDHQSFTVAEQEVGARAADHRLSLGSAWLHGHHCIHIVQWLLDAEPGV